MGDGYCLCEIVLCNCNDFSVSSSYVSQTFEYVNKAFITEKL